MIHRNHKAYRFVRSHPEVWWCPSNRAKIANYLTDHDLPYKGTWFTITGFAKSVNNGTFYCLGSSTSGLNLQNARAVQETHAATANQLSFISLQAPAGAAFLSLGINDTQLWDNTGNFTFDVVLSDTFGWNGDVSPFARVPFGPLGGPLFGGDNIIKGSVFFAPSSVGQMKPGAKLIDAVGQLFPRRKN